MSRVAIFSAFVLAVTSASADYGGARRFEHAVEELREHAWKLDKHVSDKGERADPHAQVAVRELALAAQRFEVAFAHHSYDEQARFFHEVRCKYFLIRDRFIGGLTHIHRVKHHWREIGEEFERLAIQYPAPSPPLEIAYRGRGGEV